MNQSEEIQLEGLKTELLKAQIIALELVNDINNSRLGFDEKQIIDTKIRIVCDYIRLEMKKIDNMLE